MEDLSITAGYDENYYCSTVHVGNDGIGTMPLGEKNKTSKLAFKLN